VLKRFSSFFSIKKFYLKKKTIICVWDYFLCVKDLLLSAKCSWSLSPLDKWLLLGKRGGISLSSPCSWQLESEERRRTRGISCTGNRRRLLGSQGPRSAFWNGCWQLRFELGHGMSSCWSSLLAIATTLLWEFDFLLRLLKTFVFSFLMCRLHLTWEEKKEAI